MKRDITLGAIDALPMRPELVQWQVVPPTTLEEQPLPLDFDYMAVTRQLVECRDGALFETLDVRG